MINILAAPPPEIIEMEKRLAEIHAQEIENAFMEIHFFINMFPIFALLFLISGIILGICLMESYKEDRRNLGSSRKEGE